MKDWVVDYSVKYSDESIEEGRFTVTAETISFATEEANRRLQEMADESVDPYVVDAVVWNIGMIVDDEMDLYEVFMR